MPEPFMRRTNTIYQNHRRHATAKGRSFHFTLNQIRELFSHAIGLPCTYCESEITLKNASLDHKTPLSRKGQNDPTNLVVCCIRCNQTKGSLTDEEYQHLRFFLNNFEAEARTDVLSRMRAGAARKFGGR
jgi:5-methylcytosine-specific restriction endonuclease McrA